MERRVKYWIIICSRENRAYLCNAKIYAVDPTKLVWKLTQKNRGCN